MEKRVSLKQAIWDSGHTLKEFWLIVSSKHRVSYKAFGYHSRVTKREVRGFRSVSFWNAVDFALSELEIDWG